MKFFAVITKRQISDPDNWVYYTLFMNKTIVSNSWYISSYLKKNAYTYMYIWKSFVGYYVEIIVAISIGLATISCQIW